MSWIEDGTLPDWLSGFTNVVTMGQRINQKLLDLAARVADGGWQTLGFTAGNFSAGGNTPMFRQVGPFVEIVGSVQRSVIMPSGGGLNGANIFNNLPSSAFPTQDVWFVSVCQIAGTKVEGRISATDGGIQLRNTGTVDVPVNTPMGVWAMYLAG